jgi:hypothetical protein
MLARGLRDCLHPAGHERIFGLPALRFNGSLAARESVAGSELRCLGKAEPLQALPDLSVCHGYAQGNRAG